MAGMMSKSTHSPNDADYPAELIAAWQVHYRRALEGHPFKIIWTDSMEGNATYEKVSYNPVYDQHELVSAISCFFRDITDARTDRESYFL
jgi:hypothetical protein